LPMFHNGKKWSFQRFKPAIGICRWTLSQLAFSDMPSEAGIRQSLPTADPLNMNRCKLQMLWDRTFWKISLELY
jgi:hypothetical protein